MHKEEINLDKIELQSKETISYSYKLSKCGPGEWMDEPDFCWFSYKGFTCYIHRKIGLETEEDLFSLGHLCGYMVISKDHPFHKLDEKAQREIEENIDVHGGVSYKSLLSDMFPENSLKTYWLVGFDCSHSEDFSPGTEKINQELEEKFKTVCESDDFDEELKKVAKQYLKSYLIIKKDISSKKTYKNLDFCIYECCKMVDSFIREFNKRQQAHGGK